MATPVADVLNRMFAAAFEVQSRALHAQPLNLSLLNYSPGTARREVPEQTAAAATPPPPPPPRGAKRSRKVLLVLKKTRLRVNHSVEHDLRAIRRLDEVLAEATLISTFVTSFVAT